MLERKICVAGVRDYKPAGLGHRSPVTGRLHTVQSFPSRCQRVLAWVLFYLQYISSMDVRIETQHNVVLLTVVAPSLHLRPSKPAVGDRHPLTRRPPSNRHALVGLTMRNLARPAQTTIRRIKTRQDPVADHAATSARNS